MARIPGQRRELTDAHLQWMGVPTRFWPASIDEVVDPGLSGPVREYLRGISDHLDAGHGLLLRGTNGTGKTCAAIVIAKEARRLGASVYFCTAEFLRQSALDGSKIEGEILVADRAMTVELLVLDDLGKEHSGDSGWAERFLENMLRSRSANGLTTIITTNMTIEKLEVRYKTSMVEVLKETTIAIKAGGESLRKQPSLSKDTKR